MSAKYKTSYKAYPAWDYQEEIADLNQASEKGWQLVKGGAFHSRFKKNPDIRYRYQMDYQKVDDMGRYIETFREQGWEYINSTFNGWHYFRKIYDPSLQEEAYDIFTDKESLCEMNRRWTRLSYIVGALIGALDIIYLVSMIMSPTWKALVRLLTFAVTSALLFYGGHKMRSRESGRNYRGSRAIFATFVCIIVIGCAATITLAAMRQNFSLQRIMSDEVSEALIDNRIYGFDVKYSDNYYLDLDMKADVPFTFEIVTDNGEIMYSKKGTDVHEENICIKLPKGQYLCSITVEAGYELSVSIE